VLKDRSAVEHPGHGVVSRLNLQFAPDRFERCLLGLQLRSAFGHNARELLLAPNECTGAQCDDTPAKENCQKNIREISETSSRDGRKNDKAKRGCLIVPEPIAVLGLNH
jgi:hypothetical protein